MTLFLSREGKSQTEGRDYDSDDLPMICKENQLLRSSAAVNTTTYQVQEVKSMQRNTSYFSQAGQLNSGFHL